MHPRAGIAALLVVAAVATACGGGGTTEPPATGTAPSSAAADGLDAVAAAEGRPPPRDAELAEATWPATAAWIAREVEAGRPVVVNFFASWCGPCEREVPLLTAAADRHDGVAFLGVAYRDFERDARRFVADTGIDYATLLDFRGRVGGAVGVRGMPTTLFFDSSGRLVETVHGELSAERLSAAIDRIIA